MAKQNKETKNAKVFIVESPVKNFCGINAGGVHFAYGKAEVNEGWVLNWYRKHGYKVTPKEAPKEAGESGKGDENTENSETPKD